MILSYCQKCKYCTIRISNEEPCKSCDNNFSNFIANPHTKGITDIIKEWKNEAGLNKNDIILINDHYTLNETLTIYTNKIYWLVGEKGHLYDKYKEIITNKYPNIKHINLVRTCHWYIR
jgi:hypothetical protein